MDLIKQFANIAFVTAQRILTSLFVIFTLIFSYGELMGGGGWVVAGTFLIASGLFWWAGSGLHGAFLGGQRMSGIFFATLFCGVAYWLVGTLPSNFFHIFMGPLSWGICGFVFGWLSTSKSHTEPAISPKIADPLPLKKTTQGDTPDKIKEQLFFEWATENFGDEEAGLLYGAHLNIQRFNRQMSLHGDFEGARQSLLNIAIIFPNVGAMSVGPFPPPDPVTRKYSQWFDRWCVAYPPPPQNTNK